MHFQRMLLTLSLLGPALALGCSHQQPPAATVAEAEPAPAPAPKPPAQVEAPAVAEAPVAGTEIFFDFDSSNLRDDARPILQKVANELKAGSKQVRIEGNCDDLGTPEYNVALGEQRARAAKEYLTRLGVSENRIQVVSYGAERPKYQGQNDDARAKNRRDDLVVR